jgi:WS/DGAT/MGAT family acyltransferase
MEKLGAFDHFFYKAEQYDVASMVMCGVVVLSPRSARQRLSARRIADHLAARLEKIPLMRSKFLQDPLRIGTVVRVEDPDFDVRRRIDVTTVAKPGGYRQLAECVARISEEPLDVSQLWRWTVIGGLEGGKLAIVCRIHHALADGLGAAEALSAIYDREPVKPEKPKRRPAPGENASVTPPLLRRALVENAQRLLVKTPGFVLTRGAPILAALGRGAWQLLSGPEGAAQVFKPGDAKLTSLNIEGFPKRRSIAWKTLSRVEIKSLARQFDCTVNDIGLLLFSYALEHYFAVNGEPGDFDLFCGIPLSTRGSGKAAGGNQVSVGSVNLHNTMPDVARRLRAIHEDAVEMKKTMRPEKPVVELEEVGELFPPAFIDLLFLLENRFRVMEKLAGRTPIYNAVLSNVPGAQEPLYVADAVLEENIPVIPMVTSLALSGGISSSAEVVTMGFHCDGDVVTDPDLFVRGVEKGLDRLRAASRKQSRPARARASSRRIGAR